MITITWVAITLVVLAFYLRKAYSKFSNVGVNHLPVIPIFGNWFKLFFLLETVGDTLTKITNAFPDDKVVGMYEMINPMYLIQDIDLVKKVTVKDFDHFVDRRNFASESDPTFGRGLLNLRGEEWKEMRSTLSPAFTSSKIRLMVPFMVDVGEEMIKILKKKIKDSGKQYIDVNLKDVTSRYANDVIATCAFGLKIESQSADSTFYIKAKDITTFGFVRILKIFLYWFSPRVSNTLKIPLTATETTKYFTNVVLATMEEREKKNIIRHDMINILNEIKRGKLIQEKETDTSAGFATVEESTVGKKVLNKESLRLYPLQLTDRQCVKDYNCGKVNKASTQDLIIRKGETIGIPIWTIHRNPELYPNPLKFDPERFSEENSHNIKPFSYMPFGVGPRNCIGSRFALCEVKVMLYILLRNMKVTPSERTSIPTKLKNGIVIGIKDGGWVRFEVRQ